MPSLNLAGLQQQLVDTLRDDATLEGVHVTAEPEEPTADQCPAVVVLVLDVAWEERYLVAVNPDTASAVVKPQFALRCIQFSAQGIADARLQRDALVDQVVGVLRRNRQLAGLLTDLRITRVTPADRPAGESIFSEAVLYAEGERLV